MKSKYIGKVYDGFRIISYRLSNNYNKSYKNNKIKDHRAYNYILYNPNTKQKLILSGNQLRLIKNGITTINKMLYINKRGGLNTKINEFRRWLRKEVKGVNLYD